MDHARNTILWLINVQGSVKASDVAKQLDVSLSCACQRLNRLVKTGELFKEGATRGARYFLAEAHPDRKNPYGPQLLDFWLRLQSNVKQLVYVRLADFGVALRLREQVRELLERTQYHHFVFIDLDGIDDVSDAFLDELVREWPSKVMFPPTLINANDRLSKRIRRLQELPPPKPPWDDPLCSS